MDLPKMLRDLLLHAEWADATVWDCVLEERGLLYESKVQSWLHHVHTVQHAFLQLWSGEEVAVPEPSDFDDALSLMAWGRETHEAMQRFHASVTPDELAEVLAIPWAGQLTARFGRPPEPVTIEQSAFQVALHTSHHRGQVVARIRELGGTPPLIDFIAWLWLGRPTATWPGQRCADG